MLLHCRIILFTLAIVLPLNAVETAQNTVEVATEKKQEKPTWRKNIYKWVGITTGVAAGIAAAAGIYFQVKRRTTSPITEQQPTRIVTQQPVQDDTENEKAFIAALNEATTVDELNKAIKKYYPHNPPPLNARQIYHTKMDELQPRIPQISRKEQAMKNIEAAKNYDELEVMIDRMHAEPAQAYFLENMVIMEQPDFIEAYFSKEPLFYLQMLRKTIPANNRALLTIDHIAETLKMQPKPEAV